MRSACNSLPKRFKSSYLSNFNHPAACTIRVVHVPRPPRLDCENTRYYVSLCRRSPNIMSSKQGTLKYVKPSQSTLGYYAANSYSQVGPLTSIIANSLASPMVRNLRISNRNCLSPTSQKQKMSRNKRPMVRSQRRTSNLLSKMKM